MINRGIKHIKDGFIGVYRHAAMSISSCFSVTVTLIMVGIFFILIYNLREITNGVEKDLKISVLVENTYSEESQIKAIEKKITLINGVESVEFSAKDEELEYFLSLYDESERELYMPDGADNPMPDTFYVKVVNGSMIETIDDEINMIEGVSETNYGGSSILVLVDILEGLRYGGLILVLAIMLLSIFLVHNTIKLTIGTRKKEISIMRYVGAKNGYIRAPFVVEGIIIGFLGSIIPCLLLSFGYTYFYNVTGGQILTKIFTLVAPFPFIYHIALILSVMGMSVGLLGSLFSVSKYLRWRR